jgi:hypothetical protein
MLQHCGLAPTTGQQRAINLGEKMASTVLVGMHSAPTQRGHHGTAAKTKAALAVCSQ